MARPSSLQYSAARMAAVATDLSDVLIVRIPAVIAAIFLVTAYRARTSVMFTPIVVRHKFISLVRCKFCHPDAGVHFGRNL